MPSRQPYKLIHAPTALNEAVADLQQQSQLSFDLEFDSNFRRYGMSLCLVQIATPDRCYIIDPLAGLDLSPVYAVLEKESPLKLVHSPGEDLRLLHSLQCFPRPLWDTELAARLLNYEQTSLSVMLEAKLGVVLSGKQQRSNWFTRPLSEEQLVYAAADAIHLFDLKSVLDKELAEKGLTEFAEDEQRALAAVRIGGEPKTGFLKSSDEKYLSPRAAYILNAVLGARDALAREQNLPPFRIAEEAPLRALVFGESTDSDEDTVRKALMPPFVRDRHLQALLDAYKGAIREADAQKLSRRRPPRERAAGLDRDRDEVFAPIQEGLARMYGKFTARFLLSNGIVGDLIKGTRKLSTLGGPYRQRIIQQLAKEAGVSVEKYF